MKTMDDKTPKTEKKNDLQNRLGAALFSKLTSTETSPTAGYQSVKQAIKKNESAKLPLEMFKGLSSIKGVESQTANNTQKLRQKLAAITRSHLPAKSVEKSLFTRNGSLEARGPPYSNNPSILVKPSASQAVLDGSGKPSPPNARIVMDPSVRNEQRRMLQLLNGVKQNKNAGFVE